MKAGGYKEIERIVRGRIARGEWPPGTQIPSEADLAREFRCARGTVGRAMSELAKSGLVARKRRAGTTVNAYPTRRATFQIPVIREDVESSGKQYSFAVLERHCRPPPAIIQARMRTDSSSPMLRLRTLHIAGRLPFMHEDRWVNCDMVPAILEADLNETSANEWLVRNAPFSHGDVFFSARTAGAGEAEALGVEPGAALFLMERITWMNNSAITFVAMAYPPGHQMHTRI